MVELVSRSRSRSSYELVVFFFLLSALVVLDLGETFLGLFLFSLTTLSRSLTHTHITHILFKCVPGRGQSCVLLRQFGGGGWRSVDLY